MRFQANLCQGNSILSQACKYKRASPLAAGSSHAARATMYLAMHTCYWILAVKVRGWSSNQQSLYVFRRKSRSEGICWAAGFGKGMEIDLRRAVRVLHNSTWCEENHAESLSRLDTRVWQDKVTSHFPPLAPLPCALIIGLVFIITRHG
jgi:hypothetical protein